MLDFVLVLIPVLDFVLVLVLVFVLVLVPLQYFDLRRRSRTRTDEE